MPVEIVKDTFQGARYQHREVAGSNGPIIHEDFKLTYASADENGKPQRLIMNFDLRDRTGQIATMKFQQVSPGEVVSLGASIFTNEGKNKDDTPNGKLYANKAVHVRIEGREDWTSSKGEKTNYVMIPKPDLEGLEVKLEAARARARTRAEEDALSPDDTNKQVAAACARVELANAIELAKVVEGKGFHKLNGQKQEAAAPTPAPSVGDGAPDEDLPIPEGDELPPGLLDEIAAASAMRDRQGMRG